MKMVFGQIIDTVKIFGSQRRIYIFIAALIILSGNVITIAVANNLTTLTSLTSTYTLLIIAGSLIQVGIVFQDLIADTLCYEVVEKKDKEGRKKADQDIKLEIGKIQILVRIITLSSAFIAVSVSGILATKFSFATISLMLPIIALISMIGSIVIKKEPKVKPEHLNWQILGGGLIYIFFILIASIHSTKYSQEAIFLIGITVVSISLYIVCKNLEQQRKQEILYTLLLMFTYRIVPSFGPAVYWWQIDELKFDPTFFATLSQIGIGLGFLGAWFFGRKIISKNIAVVILALNTIHVLLQLPVIAMSFGLHEWTMEHFGFGARTIAIFDNTVEGPFQQLGFLILCSAATYYAPKHNIVSWFALVMSLMSLAYVSGSRIIKKYLSMIFVVERGSYENISALMISTTLINFLLPTMLVLLYLYKVKKGK